MGAGVYVVSGLFRPRVVCAPPADMAPGAIIDFGGEHGEAKDIRAIKDDRLLSRQSEDFGRVEEPATSFRLPH